MRLFVSLILCSFVALPAFAQRGDRRGEEQEPLPSHWKVPTAPILSPAEQLETFQLADDNLILELFASEPMVQEPVAMEFDERGRLWVVEMRGYMPNIDGRGEKEPIGRVSILEDTDDDGRADKSTVFLDKLVLPRAIHVCNGGALVAFDEKLWFAKDNDGDDVADVRELVDEEYIESGNPEHQPNGLLRGLDNYVYSAKSDARYRLVNGKWLKQKTEFRGQWGITKDDLGRLYYNVNYSQLHVDYFPPLHGLMSQYYDETHAYNQQLATNQSVFTLRPNTGVNRGYRPGILDERGHLREFTSACAPHVYRDEYLFDRSETFSVFVCDPAANLVKRNLVWENGARLASRHAYTDREFLVSTDERFRPVWLETSPDGTLFIADMYRGINQHAQYMTTHLRNQILSRELDKGVHYGRIWRILPKEKPSSNVDGLGELFSSELVGKLSSRSGQVRDAAQRLLIERQDHRVIGDLLDVARGDHRLAAIHAVWTLEGLLVRRVDDGVRYLEVLDRVWSTMLDLVEHGHSDVAFHALRVGRWFSSEWGQGEEELSMAVRRSDSVRDPKFRVQMALSAGMMGDYELLSELLNEDPADELMRDAALCMMIGQTIVLHKLFGEPAAFRGSVKAFAWQEYQEARDTVIQSLSGIVARQGRADKYEELLQLAAAQKGSTAWRQLPILNGILANRNQLARQPLTLSAEPAEFLRIADEADPVTAAAVQSIAAVTSWPGHQVEPAKRNRLRRMRQHEAIQFEQGRKLYSVACASCHGLAGEGLPNLAPPLMDSEWLQRGPETVALLLLHGLEGPIEVGGKSYESPAILPNMPAVDSLPDNDLASVVAFAIREFGNRNVDFGGMDVTILKNKIERSTPWTAKELLEHK